MTVTIILSAQAKEGGAADLKLFIAKCLTETRAYSGCINIDIYEDTEQEGKLVFYENWESKEHYMSYLNARIKQGVMDEIGAMLVAPPEITFYSRVDI